MFLSHNSESKKVHSVDLNELQPDLEAGHVYLVNTESEQYGMKFAPDTVTSHVVDYVLNINFETNPSPENTYLNMAPETIIVGN